MLDYSKYIIFTVIKQILLVGCIWIKDDLDQLDLSNEK